MRISDWSSDVCSSDLQTRHLQMTALKECVKHAGSPATDLSGLAALPQRGCRLDRNGWPTGCGRAPPPRRRTARKGVGQGMSVYGRVDLGGRRINKQNTLTHYTYITKQTDCLNN